MKDNSNLSSQPIVDKNGVVSSRLKRIDPKTGVPSAALAAQSPIKDGSSVAPSNVNWDAISSEQARKLGESAAAGLDDPDKVWSNMDFYKGMLESNKSGIAIELLLESNVSKRLNDAWMKSYEIDQDDDTSFLRATSEEYDQFGVALADFSMAVHMADAYNGLGHGEEAMAKARVRDARENGVVYESPAEHEAPVDTTGGRFTSWSDLNPFKRRGKKERVRSTEGEDARERWQSTVDRNIPNGNPSRGMGSF